MKTAAAQKRYPRDGIPDLKKSMALAELARRDGTHSDVFRGVCDGCMELVGSIYYVTLGKKRLCPACADKINQGPASDAARSGQP